MSVLLEPGLAEIRDPVTILLEETDPLRRSQAHLVLGRRAMAREDLGTARDHLLEATDLDPTDEVSRDLLARVEREASPKKKRRSWWFW